MKQHLLSSVWPNQFQFFFVCLFTYQSAVFFLRTRSLPRRRSCWWQSSSTWRRRWFVFGSATAGRRRNASTPPAAPPLPCPARPRPWWRTKPPATARTWYGPATPDHFTSFLFNSRARPGICFLICSPSLATDIESGSVPGHHQPQHNRWAVITVCAGAGVNKLLKFGGVPQSQED